MLSNPGFEMSGSLPNVTGVAARTTKFINHQWLQVLGKGVFKPEEIPQLDGWYKDYSKVRHGEEAFVESKQPRTDNQTMLASERQDQE